MFKEAIDTFEELKKYVFIIDRGNQESLIIRFKNENFYHLIGLHKIKIDNFFPNKIMSKDKIYKHLKANIDKYERILADLLKEEKRLELRIELRISSFPYILKTLSENNTILYDLNKYSSIGSLYKGDYGLFKVFENLYCLLGLKIDSVFRTIIKCIPQSWMPNNRKNTIIEFRRPIYMKEIIKIPAKIYKETIKV